ncbi:MAG: hypothetical protein RLZZ275_549, partial [Bacteroidota bacterium]
MLNLSQHPIADRIHTDRYRSFGMLGSRYTGKWTRRAFIVFAAVVVIVLLLPWTQNIQSSG